MTTQEISQALAPLAAELLRAAREEADAVRSRAGAEAAAATAAAREQAEDLLAAARAEGLREAARQARTERIRTERETRRLVLAAQRDALDELGNRARQAAAELRQDRDLLARLRALVAERIGQDAEVTEHPDGGIVGDAPGRHIDARLPVLAERAIEELGAEVERLWLP